MTKKKAKLVLQGCRRHDIRYILYSLAGGRSPSDLHHKDLAKAVVAVIVFDAAKKLNTTEKEAILAFPAGWDVGNDGVSVVVRGEQ